MFAQFLDIIFRSLKLDRNLYKDQRYFGEAAIYFAGLIMILDGVAGAVAARTGNRWPRRGPGAAAGPLEWRPLAPRGRLSPARAALGYPGEGVGSGEYAGSTAIGRVAG